MKAIQYNISLVAGKTFKLALFSDLHLDSPDCDLETLKKHLEFCKKEGRYLIFGGDEFDALIHTDKKRYTPSRSNDNRDDQINKKLEMATALLQPYADNILFIGRGNHEESILKYSGVDMIDLLIKELNHSKHNGEIVKGNYQNFIRFNFVNKNNKSVLHYDMYQNHGQGQAAAVTKGMIDFNRIATGTLADLIFIGHKHQSIIDYSAPIMYVDQLGEIRLKNRQCIQTPSYQRGRTIDDHNVMFAERFYSNKAFPGVGSVELTPYWEGDGYKLNADVMIMTNPYAKIGELQSYKLKAWKQAKENQK